MDGDGAAELLVRPTDVCSHLELTSSPQSSINTGEGSSKDAGRAGPQANVDRDIFFMDLGNKRRATVRMFKGAFVITCPSAIRCLCESQETCMWIFESSMAMMTI